MPARVEPGRFVTASCGRRERLADGALPEQEAVERDERDSRRAAAPLAVAEGARVIDTSELNLEQSIDAVCGVISDRLGANCNG